MAKNSIQRVKYESTYMTGNKTSIAIDGRNLMHPPSGNATYLICALNELSVQQPDWVYYILTNRPLHPECEKLIIKRPNIRFLCRSYTRVGLLWYCTQLYFILKELKPNFFWAPATLLPPFIPSGVITIVTVNDMVPKDYKHTMSLFNRLYSNVLFDRSILNADLLLAISSYTANEVKSRYSRRRSHEITVGCGVDRSIFRPITHTPGQRSDLCSKYGVTEPFILFVGTVEPRKNLAFMMRLMPQLATAGFTLLVVGAKGWGKTPIAEIMKQPDFPADKIVFSGYVPTDDLVRLYNLAAVYVSTSLNEGFGLPQLEAMNCGCPVVSPHNSAMIEVVEGAGMTVKEWDVSAWCEAILSVFNNSEYYLDSGFQRSKQYEWPAIAHTIAKTLECA
jgi:glycosyltransferase involved in cell wall biosynthesis